MYNGIITEIHRKAWDFINNENIYSNNSSIVLEQAAFQFFSLFLV